MKFNNHTLCLIVSLITLVLVIVLLVRQHERFNVECNETLLDALKNQKRHLEQVFRTMAPDVRANKLKEINRRISKHSAACGLN